MAKNGKPESGEFCQRVREIAVTSLKGGRCKGVNLISGSGVLPAGDEYGKIFHRPCSLADQCSRSGAALRGIVKNTLGNG